MINICNRGLRSHGLFYLIFTQNVIRVNREIVESNLLNKQRLLHICCTCIMHWSRCHIEEETLVFLFGSKLATSLVDFFQLQPGFGEFLEQFHIQNDDRQYVQRASSTLVSK